MAQFVERRVGVADGRRGQSSVHAEASTPLVLLFAQSSTSSNSSLSGSALTKDPRAITESG
jgi:hypothetical protein